MKQKIFNYSDISFDSEGYIRDFLEEISRKFQCSEYGEEEYYFLFWINGRHYLPTKSVIQKVLQKKKIRFLGIFPRTFINKDNRDEKTLIPGFYWRYIRTYISNFSASPQGDTEEKRKALSETDSVDILVEVYRSYEKDLYTSKKLIFSPSSLVRRVISSLSSLKRRWRRRLRKIISY